MNQPPFNESSASSFADFNFWSQPFSKLQQRLLFQDSTYCTLFRYFLEQLDHLDPTATSQTASSATANPIGESDNSQDPSKSQTSSARGESHKLHLPSTLPPSAEKETSLMSNAIRSSLENYSYPIGNTQVASVNIENKEANHSKTALNDYQESSQLRQEMAQMRAELEQMRAENAQAQSQQAERIQELRAENCTLQTSVNELHARVQAQDKMLADYRGGLRAIEAAFGEFKRSQSERIDSVEATYKRDQVQAGKRQQAKEEQMDRHLKSLMDPMLAEAVEKAIRLLRRDGRRVPTPARQPSTPPLNHLYDNRMYRQKRERQGV